MDLIIRHHKTSELPQIFALITELSFFEKVPDHLTNTLELMESEKGSTGLKCIWDNSFESELKRKENE